MFRSIFERRVLKILVWLCLLAAFALASYVIFKEYRFSLNSDGAAEDMLARLAIEDGRLVPHNWIYANGDLWILSPRPFLVILYPWLGLGYSLHAAATWLTYLFLLLMVYGSCRVLAPERPRAAVIATALAAGSFSTLSFEFVVGQGAYSMYAAFALALFVFASRSKATCTSRQSWALLLLLAGLAAALVCISNATRGGVTVIAPLIAGWFAAAILFSPQPWRDRARNLNLPIIFTIIAGAIAGTLVYKYWLLPGIINSSGAATFKLASIHQMANNLMALPSSWFSYFYVIGGWKWLSPLQRVLQCFVWVVSIGLLLAPLRVVTAPKRHAAALVTFSWIALACYGVAFSALVTSTDLFDGPASMRYASFAIYASACVLALIVDGMFRHHPRVATILMMLLCLVPVATIGAWHTEATPGGITYNQRMGLIKSLESHHVGSVLASYWNAEVLSVLSAGKVEGLPVDIDKGVGLRKHAQNAPLTAALAASGGRYAIVLTRKEATPSVWKTIDGQLGKPTESYRLGPFDVGVYDRNIVDLLYGDESNIDTAVATDQLMVRLSMADFPSCRSEQPCTYRLEATNSGQHVLASGGTKPLRLGIHGVNAQGHVIKWDDGRADFPLPLYPGDSERIEFKHTASSNREITGYRLCLLQELVAWHCNRTEVQPPPKTE